MNLEAFVNAMGINVIRAIEKIQHVQEGKGKAFDPDDLIDKDWYKKKQGADDHSTTGISIAHVDDESSVFSGTKEDDEDITNIMKNNALFSFSMKDHQAIRMPSISSLTKYVTPERKKKVFSLDRPIVSYNNNNNKDSAQKTEQKTCTEAENKDQKNIDKKERTPCIKTSGQNIRRNHWSKPKYIKWSTARLFLSRRIKTYAQAIEHMSRSEVSIRSSIGTRKEAPYIEEWIDIFTNDSIHFIKPLHMTFYDKCKMRCQG